VAALGVKTGIGRIYGRIGGRCRLPGRDQDCLLAKLRGFILKRKVSSFARSDRRFLQRILGPLAVYRVMLSSFFEGVRDGSGQKKRLPYDPFWGEKPVSAPEDEP